MNRRPYGWTLALALLAAGAGAGCRAADGSTGDDEAAEEGVRVVNVEVFTAQPSTFVDYVRATGEVEALSEVTLSTEESGVIREFYVAKGVLVDHGQPIAKIDDAVLSAQVDEARAAARLAKEQYERQRRVWEESKVGSEIALLQTRSQADAAAARLAVLEARLERTVLRTPVTGVFDEKYMEVGEMAMPGSRIGRVVAAHQVKVSAGIPERFAAEVRRGATTRVTLDIFPGREFTGRVSFVGATVDAQNRTFPVEIVLDNPGRLIKPGMVANVQVVRARLDGVIVVPQNLVLRTETGYQVFVVTEREGRLLAEARGVTLGPSHQNRVVIAAGLQAGDRVIGAGARLVDHGSRVRMVGAGEGSQAGEGSR